MTADPKADFEAYAIACGELAHADDICHTETLAVVPGSDPSTPTPSDSAGQSFSTKQEAMDWAKANIPHPDDAMDFLRKIKGKTLEISAAEFEGNYYVTYVDPANPSGYNVGGTRMYVEIYDRFGPTLGRS